MPSRTFLWRYDAVAAATLVLGVLGPAASQAADPPYPTRPVRLIVNSALEVSPHDPELRRVIASYLDEIEAFFRRCLERGQGDGTITENVDTGDTARLLLGVVLGIRVAARTRPERALLEGMVRPALTLLDHPAQRRRKDKS